MKAKKLARTVLILVACALGAWLFLALLLPVLLPFLIGLAVAALAEKPAAALRRRAHLPRWLAGFVCVLLLYGLLGGGLFLLCKTICGEFAGFLRSLPALAASLEAPLARVEQWLLNLAERLPDGIGTGLRSSIESLFESGPVMGETAYEKLFQLASGFITRLPDAVLFLFTTILASFMTAAELPAMRELAREKLPQTWKKKLTAVCTRLKQTFGGWLKAQLKLMGITFLIITAGLMILRVDYPFLFGLVITLVDALPVFGTGTILIPWSLLMFLQGQTALGVGFAVLYGVAALTRQALEPRLVGKQIGLSPLITLMALYIGYRCIGIFGMILFPIGAIFAKQFWDHAKPRDAGGC